MAMFLLSRRKADYGAACSLGLFAAVLAAMIAAQLIPLPPSVWLAMPGHAQFAAIATLQGEVQPWRPISLDPDLTLNSLMDLLPVAVTLVGYARLTDSERRQLLTALIVFGIASAVLGIVQIASGPTSPAYYFPRMTKFLPVGLLGNQNHQAALLALCLPMIAVWIQTDAPPRMPRGVVIGFAAAIALLLATLVLVTRSRSGLALLVYAALCAGVLLYRAAGRRGVRAGEARSRIVRIAVSTGVVGLPAAALLLAWQTGRASSIQRFLGSEQELRFHAWPVIVRMIGTYFPFGIGFGVFDPAYRIAEPDALLSPQYLNRAHNDVLEIVLSGGLAAALLLAAFLVWVGARGVRAFRRGADRGPWAERQQLAAMIVAGFFALSLVDYPLRTSSLAVMMTILLCWLSEKGRERQERSVTTRLL